jgi:ABC-type transport system involved in cytochrome c biogenesis permease component
MAKNDQIIEYVLGLLLLFLLMPVALGSFFNVSTSGWDATTVTIWNVLPILGIIGAFGVVLYMGYQKFKK